jgi:hypothetical protein
MTRADHGPNTRTLSGEAPKVLNTNVGVAPVSGWNVRAV